MTNESYVENIEDFAADMYDMTGKEGIAGAAIGGALGGPLGAAVTGGATGALSGAIVNNYKEDIKEGKDIGLKEAGELGLLTGTAAGTASLADLYGEDALTIGQEGVKAGAETAGTVGQYAAQYAGEASQAATEAAFTLYQATAQYGGEIISEPENAVIGGAGAAAGFGSFYAIAHGLEKVSDFLGGDDEDSF